MRRRLFALALLCGSAFATPTVTVIANVACGTGSTCSTPFASANTTAGNAVVFFASVSSGTAFTVSVSGTGWAESGTNSPQNGVASTAGSGVSGVYYITASSHTGVTLTCALSGTPSANWGCIGYILAQDNGDTWSIDGGSQDIKNATAGNPTMILPNFSVTGSSSTEVGVSVLNSPQTQFGTSGTISSGWTIDGASGTARFSFAHNGAYANSAGTATGPTYTPVTGNVDGAAQVLAFVETSSSSTRHRVQVVE